MQSNLIPQIEHLKKHIVNYGNDFTSIETIPSREEIVEKLNEVIDCINQLIINEYRK